jgi:tetratricopeptide (TPR) repeat protein
VHGGDRLLWRSDSGELRAIANLERAVALDSNYAQAYAALARAYGTRSKFGLSLSLSERQTLLARGVAAASRAIALDNSLAEAHAELGYLLSLGLDPLASINELRRSIALDSTRSEVYNVLAKTYEMADRPDDALAAARRAVATDSMSAAATAELGDALYFTRHYDEALAQLQKVVAVQPPLRRTPSMLAEVYLANHQWKQTMDVLRPIGSTGPMNTGLFGYALARSGRQREARQLLERLLAAKSASAATIADLYIGLRQYDSAFVWLNRSFDDYSMHPKIMGPLFDEVRAHPEFARIRSRLGLKAR